MFFLKIWFSEKKEMKSGIQMKSCFCAKSHYFCIREYFAICCQWRLFIGCCPESIPTHILVHMIALLFDSFILFEWIWMFCDFGCFLTRMKSSFVVILLWNYHPRRRWLPMFSMTDHHWTHDRTTSLFSTWKTDHMWNSSGFCWVKRKKNLERNLTHVCDVFREEGESIPFLAWLSLMHPKTLVSWLVSSIITSKDSLMICEWLLSITFTLESCLWCKTRKPWRGRLRKEPE